MSDTEHNFKFIERFNVNITDYAWIELFRASAGKIMPFPDELLERYAPSDLRINDPIVFNSNLLGRIRPDGITLVKTKGVHALAVKPLGFEQVFAMELMMDPQVQCITLWGVPGSGKTFLAMACAMAMVKAGQYQGGIKLLKPVSYVGRSVGLLPGTIDEKLKPFATSMTQHIEKILGQYHSADIEELLEIQAVEYQRGMSHEHSIVIVDEGQNCSKHEMHTLLTRMHESSKIIICGDLTQVDNRAIKDENGLSMVLNVLRHPDDEDIADVPFFKSERRGVSLKAYERLHENI